MKELLHKFFARLGLRILSLSSYKYLKKPKHSNEVDFFPFLNDIYSTSQEICCLDIGANVGQTSLKLAKNFPNAKIFAFEPVEKTYKELQSNLASYKNVVCEHLAIGDTEGEVNIIIKEYSEWNSLVPNLNMADDAGGQLLERVQVTTLDKFLAKNNILKVEVLKSDTEGFELQVLEGAKDSLQKQLVDFIYIEVGFSSTDTQHVILGDIVNHLNDLNYKFVGLFETFCQNGVIPLFANALFVSSNKNNSIAYKQG